MRTAYTLLWRHGIIPPASRLQIDRPIQYVRFWRDWRRYSRLPGAEPLSVWNSFPQLRDATAETAIESHYFYQSVWLAQRLAQNRPRLHVDVGSDHRMVGMLTAVTRVVFTEIRPLAASVSNLVPLTGSITDLPFRDGSVSSLSCLHVLEHIGLGRYGDHMDPAGTVNGAAELRRVLAAGGNLFVSVPVGRTRLEFNAHRVHTPAEIVRMFAPLELREFSVEDDEGKLHEHADIETYASASYACGMFWFVRSLTA